MAAPRLTALHRRRLTTAVLRAVGGRRGHAVHHSRKARPAVRGTQGGRSAWGAPPRAPARRAARWAKTRIARANGAVTNAASRGRARPNTRAMRTRSAKGQIVDLAAQATNSLVCDLSGLPGALIAAHHRVTATGRVGIAFGAELNEIANAMIDRPADPRLRMC
jgi:hypothetical protein